jgi:general secretion pathway protein I
MLLHAQKTLLFRGSAQQHTGQHADRVAQSNRFVHFALHPSDENFWRRGDSIRIQGFSLIEMLVALVVLSLSLGVLYQAASGATRNIRVASEYTDAVMLAESMLADHSFVSEEIYSSSGRFGQYEWVVTSWPAVYEDGLSSEERAIAPQALQYLQIVVSWQGRNSPRTLDLLTVVPMRERME